MTYMTMKCLLMFCDVNGCLFADMQLLHQDAHDPQRMKQKMPGLLLQLRQLHQLTHLDLGHLPLTDAMLKQHIAAVTSLRKLTLDCNYGITPRGISTLTRLIQLTQLYLSWSGHQQAFPLSKVSFLAAWKVFFHIKLIELPSRL